MKPHHGAGWERLGPPRWRGEPGRLEVWYLTATDPETGTGLWLHCEVVAPTDGGVGYGHGWIALFPPDATPVWRRFGPGPQPRPPETGSPWFEIGGVTVDRERIVGETDDTSWDLAVRPSSRPLWTFPEWAWEREVLPGAQVVAEPALELVGTVRVGDHHAVFDGSTGAFARIYGHGNAARWGWLHADLGRGDCLEIVAGVSRRRVLRRLPPAPFVRFRLDGRDMPVSPLSLGRVRLDLPTWSLTALLGRRRVRAEIHIPDARSVAVPYIDPDGARAICTNSERADAEVVLERFTGRWLLERRWKISGTAHSEVGLRPDGRST